MGGLRDGLVAGVDHIAREGLDRSVGPGELTLAASHVLLEGGDPHACLFQARERVLLTAFGWQPRLACNPLHIVAGGGVADVMDYRGVVVTYQEIARLAGVSTATVSRVLAGNAPVSGDLRQRVLDAAEQLSYRTNRAARALRRQRADTIGLILSDIEYPFYATVARVVESACAERGLAVFVCNTDEDLDRERFYLDLMIAERVSGVIISPAVEDPAALDVLARAEVPSVTVDRIDPSGRFDAVLLDNATATAGLVRDLVAHGHRRFMALMGTTAATSSRERVEAMRAELARVAGATLFVAEGALQETAGLSRTMGTIGRRALDLVSGPDAPTAVVCANAVMAMSAIEVLLDAGVRVPEDVAVVAFDDMPGFGHFSVPITVAAQPTELMGRRAAELLLDRIDDSAAPRQVTRLPPELRLRSSCGPGHPSR